MDGPRECHTEWRKSDGEREMSYEHPLYVESKKKPDELAYKTETQDLENELMVAGGKGWLGIWGGSCTHWNI